jgi:hypothetical protein
MNTFRRMARAPVMPFLVTMMIFLAGTLPAQEYADVTPDTGPEFRADPKDTVRITGAATKGRKTVSVSVTTNVAKAEVYLDGVYCGLTPGVIDGVAPGIRRLEIRKDGYYRKAWFIRVEAGTNAAVYAELSLITGILSVTGLPPGGVVMVDQTTYTAEKVELPAGLRTITLRSFGYEDRTVTVIIDPRKELTIEANLAKAVFTVKGLRVSRAAFNPLNPEGLGCADIFFTVSAPGSGTLTISGENGETVFTAKIGPFDTWSQSARWYGKDDAGKTVSDGRYDIRIDAGAQSAEAGVENNPERITLTSTVTVDKSITYPMTGSLSGTGAVGPVVSAALMPAGGALMRTEIGSRGTAVSFGISASAGIAKYVEAGFEAGAIRSDSGASNAVTATALAASIKSGGTFGNFSVAGALRYSAVVNAEKDSVITDGTRRGFAIGPAIEYRMGPVIAGASAEIQYGDARGLFSKPYLGAAAGLDIRAEAGILAGGIFTGAQIGERESLPVFSSGAFAHIIVPATSLTIFARAGADWNAGGIIVPAFAGGFGFIF